MKHAKKLLSLLLAAVLLFGLLPLSTFARYEEYYGDNAYYRYNDYYYGDYYRRSGDYYTYYDGVRYYNDDRYYDYFYRNYYDRLTGDVKTMKVLDAEGQVYDGGNKISFTIEKGSKAGLLGVVVNPKKNRNRNNEIILERKEDYLLKTGEAGLILTLTSSLLDDLDDGDYEVKMFFTTGQGNAVFTVEA